MRDFVSSTQQLRKSSCSEDISQRRLGKKSLNRLQILLTNISYSGLASTINGYDAFGGVDNLVVAHGINSNGDRIFGKNLLRWNIKHDCTQIDFAVCVREAVYEENSGSTCFFVFKSSQTEDRGALIFLKGSTFFPSLI